MLNGAWPNAMEAAVEAAVTAREAGNVDYGKNVAFERHAGVVHLAASELPAVGGRDVPSGEDAAVDDERAVVERQAVDDEHMVVEEGAVDVAGVDDDYCSPADDVPKNFGTGG
ncbi:hypothetical protein PTI98_009884 [Pleurotus ostreatus]|nr:hypothetical protein PTI98_009884 [Pleurotus ostreatus]